MARGKSKKSSAELVPVGDPKAPLDGQELLKHAAPVLRQLEEDLLERARKSEAMTLALTGRYEEEKQKQRTADPFDVWQRAFVEQVAAAWFLSCVFVRTLEDRGLVERNRLAGPGAADSQRSFFELAPSLTERDYLLTVFRELERFEAARDLFDSRHNPVWLLAPSAEATKALLGLFRMPNAEEPAFRFGGSDTRFLGDLYQDLSENVRKRYALLQTPRFVESYILDRTLEPAIERFGLNEATLMDPTCGSGHFLLGGFERMVEHKLRAEPGLSAREAAAWALGTVYGVDINPYAVAIARFRLTLAFLERAGFGRLREAPRLDVNLAVADSLLENPNFPTLATLPGQRAELWFGDSYSLDQPEQARAILAKRHAAVVGNPPYINVKDAALRRQYAQRYPSCAMNYALTIPFCERFFQAARQGGSVGMITANSFMKREFGKRLIEQYLPKVNLKQIVNTSGAFIPGHGTPTVLLFGSVEPSQGTDVLTVLANRGEPSTPDDPEQGLVWRSIAEHSENVGFENEFISVMRTERKTLAKHPWSLGGGGTAELKELLESRAEKRLAQVVDDIGFSVIIGEDEVFIRPASHHSCKALPSVPLVIGEEVRDWALTTSLSILRPFNETTLEVEAVPELVRALWPWRTTLANRVVSGSTTMKEANRQWFDVRRLARDKHRWPLSIAFAFVATHNHFVLDRGGKVFKQSAPIIKLPESATEDDHLALLAYLNSSTACFWMKQVFFDKGNRGGERGTPAEPWEAYFEFDGTKIAKLPIPPMSPQDREELVQFGRELSELGMGYCGSTDPLQALSRAESGQSVEAVVEALARRRAELEGQIRDAQERLDWLVYRLFGLTAHRPVAGVCAEVGARASDVRFARLVAVGAIGRRYFELCRLPQPVTVAESFGGEVGEELREIERSPNLAILESVAYKRTYRDGFRPPEWSKAMRTYLAAAMESALQDRAIAAIPMRELAMKASAYGVARRVLSYIGSEQSEQDRLRAVADEAAVPFLAAWRYSAQGLEKHYLWQRAWSVQRCEDAGDQVESMAVPPKYGSGDFAADDIWRLRGKLDVPKERFISYPGCESDEDGEPVYGWAGWDHLQRAQALAALYQDRKEREGWEKHRLVPMLAGLLELIPWVKQWHNEPSEEYGGLRLGEYFESYLKGECVELGLTEDDLRGWRPDPKGRGAKKTAKAKTEAPKKPSRKRKAKGDEET
ncbi:MAG: BREX-2 system adenine-specific DNA-methyltransferase PglX [Polyangiaceae bacterium]|nr:BREX-2 system adenine-specific DNA-methyltransferase PglX [Polyangiaceae bacterium]